MRRIISVVLLGMAVSVPVFAMDNDREARMDEARKEMRALQDRQLQERRALEDEMHGKMSAMRERHQKEREELKARYGMDKGGKGGQSVRSDNRSESR